MRSSIPTRIGLAFTATAACFTGCVALQNPEPPPMHVPGIVVHAEPHVGSFLTGPLPVAALTDAALPFAVRQRVLWVESPIAAGASLDKSASLVLGPGDPDPLRPVARRAGGIGFLRGSAAADLLCDLAEGHHGRTSSAFDELGFLNAGTTLRLHAESAAATKYASFLLDATRAGAPAEARIAVQLGLRGDTEREQIVLADPLRAADGPIVFVFSRSPRADEPAALVVALEIDANAAPIAQQPGARTGFESSAAAAAERRRDITRAEKEHRELQGVLADLGNTSERRARLVFLASSCGAPLALDVALVAQDADLAVLAAEVKAALPDPVDRASSAWPIERATWIFLGRMAAAGTIAPELSGALARAGGEAARVPAAIEDLTRGIARVEDFEARLVNENRILLEDAAPSSRVRAFDWLAARGLAPQGFDPLGTLDERRVALRKLADAEEAAATAAEKPR